MGMLVLTMKAGEGIVIGDDITVRVLSVKGERIKVGVDAPRKTEVDREKVRGRKEVERSAAAK